MHVQVLLPLKLTWVPWYRCEENIFRGTRVTVSFSGKKYVGVVWSVGGNPDIEESRIQSIDSVAKGLPAISEEEIRLWDFLAAYYLCTPGEVFKAAYPSSRVKSEETLSRIRERKLKKEGKTACETKEPDCRRSITSPPPGNSKPLLFIGQGRLDLYLQKTRQCIQEGKSVLILIPEIAISEKLQQTFEAELGPAVRLYNSLQTARQRRDTAEALRDTSSPEVIIGTRCAVFLPYKELGLIIVDEEQDQSYKQTEPDPRMNARDAAVILGKIHGSEVILGSSAPSLESLYNSRIGKYKLGGRLETGCEVPIIDVVAEKRKRGMVGHFSRKLIVAASEVGSELAFIRGWEKPEELEGEIKDLFPEKHVSVFTAKEALRLPDADIRRLDLVAVLQADALFPKGDFRADERAFQLLRRLISTFPEKPIIIQTAKSGHPVFKALEGNVDSNAALEERRLFNLPPYSRAVDVILRDNAPKRLEFLSSLLTNLASCKLGQVTKPRSDSELETQFSVSPMIQKDEGEVTLRWYFPRPEAERKKKILLEVISAFEKDKKYTGHIQIDVDPV